MTKVERLRELGFIYKHISGNWYLVRIYAGKSKLLYHLIIPMYLQAESEGEKCIKVLLK